MWQLRMYDTHTIYTDTDTGGGGNIGLQLGIEDWLSGLHYHIYLQIAEKTTLLGHQLRCQV